MADKPNEQQRVASQWECKGIITILNGIMMLLRNMSYEFKEANRGKMDCIERSIKLLTEELEALSKS